MTYCISPDLSQADPILSKSIKKYGIITPPLVTCSPGNTYTILSGFKRIALAMNTLSSNNIVCLVLPDYFTEKDIYCHLIAHATTGKDLSPIEKALFFKKTKSFLSEQETITLFSDLGLIMNRHLIKEHLKLLELESSTIDGIHNGSVHLKAAKLMGRVTLNDQGALTHLIKRFAIGGSKQQKLVEYSLELMKRKKISFQELWGKIQESMRIQNQNNKPQEIQSILLWLKEHCYPRLDKEEKQFKRFSSGLRLPGNVQLQHAKSFETDQLRLTITFQNEEQLTQSWDTLKESI